MSAYYEVFSENRDQVEIAISASQEYLATQFTSRENFVSYM